MAAKNSEFAVLGGGCFWCLEAVLRRIDGIISVVNGYSGGQSENPTYEQVCSSSTGHAEVVRVEYDPAKISYEGVLEHFWKMHDPTTLNRQGADVGTQYRSIILYADERQKVAAERSMNNIRAHLHDKVVTELLPLERFWPAEDYHQQYFDKHPFAGYCQAVIRPKLAKLSLRVEPLAQ